ncbi:MAG TPA: sensor histidine kinase [Acidimicrobiia bacterium]|nr:sensor histidine kinase [Acidimicrobiia bacterium]
MKRRLLLSYLSITAFVLLVLEIPFGVSYANSVERRLTSDIQHDAFALAIRAQESIDTASTSPSARAQLQEIADDYRADAGGRVVIVDRQGRTVADSDRTRAASPLADFSNRPEIMDALDGAEASGIHSSPARGEDLYVALPVGSAQGIQGAIRISYPASVVADRIRHIWLLLAATGGVVLGIVFLVSLLLARSVTRPLGELEQAAGALGAGDLGVRAQVPKGPDEVRVLAESFNATAARLEQLVGGQRAFVADASHQLRTPLAALRLRLENLEADVTGHAADDLEGALAEVARLSQLVDGLLALTRAEQSTSSPMSIPVAELLHGRTDAWGAFAAERHIRIESVVPDALTVRATPGRLEQVVDNLLNNALEVAPVGSAVGLVAVDAGNWIELRVSDEGPGMTAEERARAFDRFWQAAGARRDGRTNGHFGLGLAIVRELVVADGGNVRLEPSPAGGLEVIVRMRRGERVERNERSPVAPRERQLSTTSG